MEVRWMSYDCYLAEPEVCRGECVVAMVVR